MARARARKRPYTVIVVNHQTGKVKSIKMDKKLRALKPGKRISRSGNTYYESRKNRSDTRPTLHW